MKSLRGRFTIAGIGALLSVVVLLIALGSIQSGAFTRSATQQAQGLVDQSIDQIILDTYGMVEAQGELLDKINDQALATSKYSMDQLGKPRLDHSKVETWKAINQFSKEETTLHLPKMMLGDHAIERNTDPAKPTAVVELTHSIQGGVPTLWQRLPKGEGFIRVSTWVVKDGKRQIGTYIPKIQPDGKANPVVAAVESGKTYRGIAYVMGKWLLAVYQPLLDSKGELIGMSSTSVEQEAATGLRKSFIGVKLGKRGKVYSLGTTGDRAGKFFISPDGSEDQVVALESKGFPGNSIHPEDCGYRQRA